MFTLFLCKSLRLEGQKVSLSFNSVFTRYLKSILFKLCILVYNLEITVFSYNLNFDKIYSLFVVNYFSSEIMVV